MKNLKTQVVASLITPWGLLDLLNTADAAGKTVRYSSLTKVVPWENETISAQFQATIKSLESHKFITMHVDYPHGMNIAITKLGKNKLSPSWRKSLNDSFKMVNNMEKAPMDVPVQMVNLRGVAITDEILKTINENTISQASAGDPSVGKLFSNAWKCVGNQTISHAHKPTVMGWRYREDAFVMVHTPETNHMFKLSEKGACSLFNQAVPTISSN